MAWSKKISNQDKANLVTLLVKMETAKKKKDLEAKKKANKKAEG